MHLVMFDIDGTLVDSNGFDGELYAQAVRRVLGVEVDRTWQSYRHVTDSGILEEVLEHYEGGGDVSGLAAEVKTRFIELVREYLVDESNKLEPVPGACQLIDQLQSSPGVTVAIATGGWKETAELKLAAVGIECDRTPLATSSDAVSRIEIMRLAEQRAAADGPFLRRTYFGDAPWDLAASAELGYAFVAIGPNVEHSVSFNDLSDHDGILSKLGV